MRIRRGHDLRRTFITLAQEDGARRDVLQVITHAPDASDVMSLYTSYPWPVLCTELAKLRVELPAPSPTPGGHASPSAEPSPSPSPSPPAPSLVAGPAPGTSAGAGSSEGALVSAPSAPAGPALPGPPEIAVTARSSARPMEPRHAPAHVLAETRGAPRSLGGVTVAAARECSATCSAENPVISSRCPGLNRGPTVYEGGFTCGNHANSHDVSANDQPADVDPHASSHILGHEPDQIALRLLEAQAAWLASHDRVTLRRTLLELVLRLEG